MLTTILPDPSPEKEVEAAEGENKQEANIEEEQRDYYREQLEKKDDPKNKLLALLRQAEPVAEKGAYAVDDSAQARWR